MDRFQTCTEVSRPPDLETLPSGAHLEAQLLCHAEKHGVPIALTRIMDKEEKEASILYGTYASANKEAECINTELFEQVQAGHVAISPLEVFNALHNLWLSPVTVKPQVGRRLRLIFNFTWSELNDVSKGLPPIESISFRGAL